MRAFWKNKKVLVTGANGFIGTNLIKRLIKEGAKVIALTHKGLGHNSLLSLEGLANDIYRVERGSVKELKDLKRVTAKEKIKVIYHLAAQPLVEVGRKSPIETFEVNVKGTWNVLEIARMKKVERVIVASTTHVYGDNPHLPYKEEYFPQPSRPYETSKACADLLAQSFADTYSVPVEVPRFVNIYGPGDSKLDRIVPKTIKALISGKNPEIFDVGAVRDFLFVDDAIDAYLILAEKRLPNKKRVRVFNFGSGQPVEIRRLAQKLVSLYGKGRRLKIHSLPEVREKEIVKQYVSIKKAKDELGWRPRTGLDEGLKKTIAWYEKHKGEF